VDERDSDFHLCVFGVDGKLSGGCCHPDLATHPAPVLVLIESVTDVTAAVVGEDAPRGPAIKPDLVVANDPTLVIVGERDLVNKAHALRVVRPQRRDESTANGSSGRELNFACGTLFVRFDGGARDEDRGAGRRLCDDLQATLYIERLLHVDRARRSDQRTVRTHQPGIERPAIPERGHQAPGIHDRKLIAVRDPQRRPVAMSEVDVG
jgi:hypothetical protein